GGDSGLRKTETRAYKRSGNRRRRGGRGVVRRVLFIGREPGMAEHDEAQGGGGRSRSRPTRCASPTSGAPTSAPRTSTCSAASAASARTGSGTCWPLDLNPVRNPTNRLTSPRHL